MEFIALLLAGIVPFLVAFAALLAVTLLAVVGMLWIFGRVSGLNRLGQAHPAPSPATGPTLAGRTYRLGRCGTAACDGERE